MSFWEKDYNALFITSFYKNPAMHSSEDTIAKVNPIFVQQAAQALIGLMRTLADE